MLGLLEFLMIDTGFKYDLRTESMWRWCSITSNSSSTPPSSESTGAWSTSSTSNSRTCANRKTKESRCRPATHWPRSASSTSRWATLSTTSSSRRRPSAEARGTSSWKATKRALFIQKKNIKKSLDSTILLCIQHKEIASL